MESLKVLIEQTPDVIDFLRSLVDVKPQPPVDREGAQLIKPHSTPPLNIDAVDAADLELATLAHWGGVCGVPWQGCVWRDSGGRVRGVLYGDSKPARTLVAGFTGMFRTGWSPPDGMLESIQAVRFQHYRLFPGLDARFGEVPDVVEPVQPQLF